MDEFNNINDGDVCNRNELNRLYQNPYHCSARKAVGLEKLYILHLDCHWDTKKLAAGLSNNSIHLTSSTTLEKISTFIAHNQNLVDVHFSPTDPNSLFTASSDGSVRMWDVRHPQKHTQEYRGIILLIHTSFYYKNIDFQQSFYRRSSPAQVSQAILII